MQLYWSRGSTGTRRVSKLPTLTPWHLRRAGSDVTVHLSCFRWWGWRSSSQQDRKPHYTLQWQLLRLIFGFNAYELGFLFFFLGGGRLPSYRSLRRGWDVTKLPGLSQKRSSKARVRPISWWKTYLQDISNNPFNSPHHGCLSRSSTSQGSPPGLPREPLQPHWGPWHQFRPSFLQHSGTWSTNRHLWRIQPSQLASWLVCICITEALMIWDKTRALKCFSSLRSCTLPSLQLHKPQRSPFPMSSSGRHRGTNHPSTLLP